ncbi:MAG: membrane protein insertion efficiency factor YidD [Mariprofundaceae bacterium]|nr:membrane protein insertion efficiency factor YidD [Mariprofundaceae bacterium]
MKRIVLWPVRAYQYFISPFIPSRCMYTPSCSQYMLEAVQLHGILRGVFLGTRRFLRCHPFTTGGYDPVPEKHHHPH